MTVDKREVLELVSDFYFHTNDETGKIMFTEWDIDDFEDIVRENCAATCYARIEHGASKMVIIQPDKDYVIKMPFTGEYFEDFDVYDDEGTEKYKTEMTYVNYYGADTPNGWDYCAAEASHYMQAVAEGFGVAFAPCHFLADGDIPIYVQDKCEIFKYSNLHTSKEEREKTSDFFKDKPNSNSMAVESLPLDWLTAFRLKHGEQFLLDFLNFLEENGWDDDLREANIGFLNGNPVLVDYSGFAS